MTPSPLVLPGVCPDPQSSAPSSAGSTTQEARRHPATLPWGARRSRGWIQRAARTFFPTRPPSGFTVLLHFLSANSAAGRLDRGLPHLREKGASPFRPGFPGAVGLARRPGS